jgi:hypothetical protein
MLNLSNIKKQILSLIVLESIVMTGIAATPSFANHKSKADRAASQQVSQDNVSGEKLALVEGTVTVHQAPDTVEETRVVQPPLTYKQIEKCNMDFGSFGAGGL